MKCLSLKQPFAELLVLGKKTIELRVWNTNFRGEFLVHASKKPDAAACASMGFYLALLTRGAIIGKAFLYGVREYNSRDEFMADRDKHLATEAYVSSKYGFLIKDAVRFEVPIPMRGQLNFFNVEI